MLVVEKDANLDLWDAAGFFRLLSCYSEDEMSEYKKYNDSLMGTFNLNVKVNQQKDICGVYVLYFESSGHFYIGSSVNVAQRVAIHNWQLRKDRHHNNHMSAVFKKYGKPPETIFINTFGDKAARAAEQRLIDLVFMDPYCLNQRQMVEEYRPATETTREKLSKAASNQWNDEFRKKIQAINKKPETLAKRIENGRRLAQDPEYLKKLSDASKKLWEDPEYIAGQRASGAAVWKEEGFKERHAEAMKAKWADPEYKANAQRGLLAANAARQKPVTIGGVQYPNAKAAAQALGMSETSVRRKCDK
jgi:group I intron endonuclease